MTQYHWAILRVSVVSFFSTKSEWGNLISAFSSFYWSSLVTELQSSRPLSSNPSLFSLHFTISSVCGISLLPASKDAVHWLFIFWQKLHAWTSTQGEDFCHCCIWRFLAGGVTVATVQFAPNMKRLYPITTSDIFASLSTSLNGLSVQPQMWTETGKCTICLVWERTIHK